VHRRRVLFLLLVSPLGNRMGRMRRLLRVPRKLIALHPNMGVFGSTRLTRITRNCLCWWNRRQLMPNNARAYTPREHCRLKW
jgi:hypothetical protein